MKKLILFTLCLLLLSSCCNKEVYNKVESSVKVDRIKNMDSHNKISDKLLSSEFIGNLDKDNINILKDNVGFIYNSKSDELIPVDNGYSPYDVNNDKSLLYKVDDSYFKELVVKGKNDSRKINFEKHVSDAKLSKDKVYAVKIEDSSQVKFFKGNIFEEKNGTLEDTKKQGKLLRSNDDVYYCAYENNKLTVKDMNDKEIFSREMNENQIPLDMTMYDNDVIYSVFDSKENKSYLYRNDKLILKSELKNYQDRLKPLKSASKYVTWFDSKVVYNAKDNKIVYFENGTDDRMLVPVGEDVYGLKINNAIGVFNDKTVKFK